MELFAKCLKVSRLAVNWLSTSDLHGEVLLVRLRCLRGIFDLQIQLNDEVQNIEVREELVDDLLQAGSRDAEESLLRLFEANFGRFAVLKGIMRITEVDASILPSKMAELFSQQREFNSRLSAGYRWMSPRRRRWACSYV